MGVDETRKDGRIAEVDEARTCGHGESRAYCRDPAAFDDHDRVTDRRLRLSIEEPRRFDCRDRGWLLGNQRRRGQHGQCERNRQ